MSVDDYDLGDFFEGDGEQDTFGDKKYLREQGLLGEEDD